MKKPRRMTFAACVFAYCIAAFAWGQEKKTDQPLSRDQLRIAAQQICPTSGTKLGEHGTPIKVKVGKEHVFLCCKGCLKKKISPKPSFPPHVLELGGWERNKRSKASQPPSTVSSITSSSQGSGSATTTTTTTSITVKKERRRVLSNRFSRRFKDCKNTSPLWGMFKTELCCAST